MNDPLLSTNFSAVQPADVSISPAALWPRLTEKLTKHRFVHSVLLGRRELPLFCNPLIIFLLNWVLMLVSLSFQITYVSYPVMGMPVLLFALSLGSFLFGYLVARTLLHRWPTRSEPLAYTLNVTRLWQINLLFCAASLLIIGFNWILSGPPPALGDPSSYLTYGRFKQVLFPLLVVITVNSMLDASRWRKVLFAMFGIAGMALYITRGLLMVALLQMLFVFSLKTRMNRKKLYSIAAGCLALAIVAITLIGNARTAQGVFLEYLQIRHKYFDWPMAYLWLTSYISIPISNLCWLFAKGSFHGPTLSFLYPLLPSFLTPANPHASIHDNLSIIDGASTYLAAYALDFSYLGVYLANLLLGVGCGWLMERSLPKNILVAGIFLGCLSFIFFSDMFTPLSTILEFAIQSAVQRKCFHWADTHDEGMVPK
ncbi:MAG TPA: O-antigen polymerase [Terracidiphilus sp.]|nr:O-antigen polymerase [Terracidiphilus sp.]